jgi:outer membrane protein
VQGLPPSEDSAVRQASERNPQVLSAQANEQAARAGIDLAEAQLMPSLAANGQLLHVIDQNTKGERIDSAQAVLTLTVPIYQGRGEYSKVRAAKETYGQRQNQIEAALRVAKLNATAAWQNLQAARANIESFQAQIDANQIAYEGVVEQNQVGTRTLLDILNAQQELFKSQVNLVGAQHNEAVSAYQLKSAVGDLTALALQLPIEHYDSKLHYDEVREKWIGADPTVP